MPAPLHTVIETPPYLRDAARCMTETEQQNVVNLLAAQPFLGALVPGGGGIRKLRVALSGRGKRGGARVIYYVHSARLPVFLLACFAKNERSDLTAEERRSLAAAVKSIPRTYGKIGYGKARV